MNETYVYFLNGECHFASTSTPDVNRLVSLRPLVIEPVEVRTMLRERFREIEKELAAIGAKIVPATEALPEVELTDQRPEAAS